MSEYRLKKMETLILREISTYILQKTIKDPRVTPHLTLHRAVISKDLQYAKIYVSSFEKKEILDDGVSGLNSAAGFIQKMLGKTLKTKNTPKLTFYSDTSIKEGFEINQLIERASF